MEITWLTIAIFPAQLRLFLDTKVARCYPRCQLEIRVRSVVSGAKFPVSYTIEDTTNREVFVLSSPSNPFSRLALQL